MSYGIKEIVLNDDNPVDQATVERMIERIATSEDDKVMLLMAMGLIPDPDAQWEASLSKQARKRKK